MSARIVLWFLFATVLTAPLRAQQPTATPDRVEARWGDNWFPGAVLKRDGDKVLVRFDDGVQKWLPATDTRAPAKAGGPGATAGEPPPTTAPTAAAPPAPRFLEIGSAVDAKWATRWEAATIVKKEGARFYVKYHDGIEKWVTRAELRPPQPDTMGAKKPPAAPTGAKPTEKASEKPAVAGPPAGDTSGVKTIDPAATVAYTVKPDPAPAPPDLPPKPYAAPLNLKLSKEVPHEEFSALQFTHGPPPTAWVVTNQREFFDRPQRAQVQRVDLALARQLDIIPIPENRQPLDVSDDGAQILCRARQPDKDGKLTDSSRSGALEVLRRQNNALVPLTTWRLTTEWHEYVAGAAFVDNDHVLAWREDGATTLWKLPQQPGAVPKAVYTIKLGYLVRPTFSPGGKTFVANYAGTLVFFDTLTGAPLGAATDFQVTGVASAAFRPDGVLLAIASTQRVTIVNVPGGKVFREIPIPKPYDVHTSLDWVATNHLLLGRRYLVDVLKRVVTWEYRFPNGAATGYFAGRAFHVDRARAGNTDGHALAAVAIPHEEALNAQPTVNADDLMVFKPGVKVSIDLATGAPEDVRQKILKSLQDQVRARGMEVADGQPLRITASSTDENPRQIDYRMFGGGVQKVNVVDHVHTMSVTLDGVEIWKNVARSSPPPLVSTTKDQSFEDAVRKNLEQSYTILATVKLPQVLAKPTEYPLAGHSLVTDKGIAPAPAK